MESNADLFLKYGLPILVFIIAAIQAVLAYANLRPHVRIEKILLGDFEVGKKPVVVAYFTNSGKTNANEVVLKFGVALLPPGEAPRVDPRNEFDKMATIVAGASIPVFQNFGFVLDEDTKGQIETGTLKLFVLGYFNYRGLLGVKSREGYTRQYLTWEGGVRDRPVDVPLFTSCSRKGVGMKVRSVQKATEES